MVDREEVEFHQGARLPRGYIPYVKQSIAHTLNLWDTRKSDSRSYTAADGTVSPTERTAPLSEYTFYLTSTSTISTQTLLWYINMSPDKRYEPGVFQDQPTEFAVGGYENNFWEREQIG